MPKPPIPQFTLIERRRAPRFLVDLACDVTTVGGDCAKGRICDISLTGIQLQGDAEFIQILYPNFKRQDWRTPLKVNVAFSLPTSLQKTARIALQAQLVYCKRLSSSRYKIGCQYLEINTVAQAAMEDYISHFGVPKNP